MNFKEIRLIRVLIWILLYLLMLFVSIFLVVVPVVKSYKHIHGQYLEQKREFMTVGNEHKTVLKSLKNLQSKNRKIIQAFENRWDEAKFLVAAKRYFDAIELKAIDLNESHPSFKVYEVNAKTKMQAPQNFYHFLEAVASLPYVIQADFPIAFRALKRGNQIEGVFRIKVYEEKRVKKDTNLSKPSVSKR